MESSFHNLKVWIFFPCPSVLIQFNEIQSNRWCKSQQNPFDSIGHRILFIVDPFAYAIYPILLLLLALISQPTRWLSKYYNRKFHYSNSMYVYQYIISYICIYIVTLTVTASVNCARKRNVKNCNMQNEGTRTNYVKLLYDDEIFFKKGKRNLLDQKRWRWLNWSVIQSLWWMPGLAISCWFWIENAKWTRVY